MRNVILDFFRQHHIPQDARFIVAFSGGADSIVLLHAFKYLNLNILALHCNFGLRGKESDMDEQFVKRFCDTYGIALNIKRFDTAKYAKDNGISIEMAARELRYGWFGEMKKKKNMDFIAVAHHADDVAETVFINLCRGTGIKGLTGIRPVNGDIVRPLLKCSRKDILEYISANQLGYRTDSTNSSLDYVRNKIRHLVLPVFKEINPAFLETMTENCDILKETEKIYRYGWQSLQKDVVTQEGEETLIDIEKLLNTPAPFSLLYEILNPWDYNPSQVQDILASHSSTPGKHFFAKEHVLVKGRRYWRLFKHQEIKETYFSIPQTGIYEINGKKFEFTTSPLPENFIIPNDKATAYMDAGKIRFPLLIRNWRTGDHFCPIGMKKNKKKLSDFFTDQKFSTKQKQDCLLLLSEEKIAWVIGYRLDDRFKITPLTKSILIIREL